METQNKQDSTIRLLFDFKAKKSFRDALAFCIAYTFLGIIASFVCGIIEYLIFHRHAPALFGITGGRFLAFLETAFLAFLILKHKRLLFSIPDCIVAILGAIISLNSGIWPGFPIISLLTMRSPKLSGEEEIAANADIPASRNSKKKIIMWMGITLFISILIATGFYFSNRGRTYYVDSDVAVGYGTPENRIYAYDGSFFRVVVHYPQDMFSSVLGEEFFLSKGGETHFLTIAVADPNRGGLPLRYRVRSISLSDGKKTYPFLLYQSVLHTDEIRKQKESAVNEKDVSVRNALQNATELFPKIDFTNSFGNDNLFFGYELRNPPKKLRLSFEIEVYQLGGEPKEVVKDTIELKRVTGDPMGWIKNQTRGRR